VLKSSEHSDELIEILLSDVLEVYGYDFTGYSRASLKRRILSLYEMDKFVSFAEYRYKIRTEPGYFKRFLEEITINVTEMFRDPAFYKTLRMKSCLDSARIRLSVFGLQAAVLAKKPIR
jgi:chemotaxis protein methyltransferase CheR